MQNTSELMRHHRSALNAARLELTIVEAVDLALPTPCPEWDLHALLAHMIGQNEGFATAIATGDANVESYAARPVHNPQAALKAWDTSVVHLVGACAAVPAEAPVTLMGIAPSATFPAATAVRMHLLDTVIHTWDVAAARGTDYRPTDELLTLVAQIGRVVPGGAARTSAGAAFGPEVGTTTATDTWAATLAKLGRHQGTRRTRRV